MENALVGVLLISIGAAAATARFVARWVSVGLDTAYREYRQHLGRAILLGLEFLVAGDIINTVAVDPTFRSVGVLAGIVAIRTFLSFSLESKSMVAMGAITAARRAIGSSAVARDRLLSYRCRTR